MTPGEGPPYLAVVESGTGCRLEERTVTPHRTRAGGGGVMADVISGVEESIRALKLFESEIQAVLAQGPGDEFGVDGVTNLPALLSRFLAERSQYPSFKYEVIRDDVRGWVIRW